MRKVHPREATQLLAASCTSFPKFGREIMTHENYWKDLTEPRRKVAEQILGAHQSLLAAQQLEVDWNLVAVPVTPAGTATIRLLPGDIVGIYLSKDMLELREEVKAIQGAKWAKTHWEFYLNLEACNEIPALAQRYGISMPEDVIEAIERSKKAGLAAVMDSRAASAELPEWLANRLSGTPFPFQNVGITFGMHHKRIFINDDQGLGKTMEGLGVIEGANAYKALIIVPNSVKLGWVAEAKAWLPNRSVAVYMTGKKPIKVYVRGQRVQVPVNTPYADIVIINYDQVKKHLKDLMCQTWKCILVDESHYISNAKAQRTKAVLELVNHVKPEYRLALTGTPVANKPHELIPQLEFLGRLEQEFGTKSKFMRDFCTFSPSGYGGVKFHDPDRRTMFQLNRKLRPFQVRRLKSEVLKELPDKRRITMPVEISNRSEYQLAQNELLVWLKDYVANQKKFLKSIEGEPPAVQQLLIKSRIATAEQRALRGLAFRKIQALRMVAVKGKILATIGWIKDYLEQTNEKLVVYCIHREIQEELYETFPGAARIYGGDSLAVRKANEKRFQEDPSCRLIICSIPAAAEGITLTAASNMLIIEMPWTALKCNQTEDRIHRIGQTKGVMIYYVLATETIDEDIGELIDAKRQMMAAITDGEDADEEMGIMDSLISRLTD